MVAQLEHVRVILSQNGDCVALLPDHQACLLLVRVAEVDAIKLEMGAVLLETETKRDRQIFIFEGQLLPPYLQELIPVLQTGLMCDAASCHFRHKHSPVFPTNNGDSQRFCSFLNCHIARLFQVRPLRGREKKKKRTLL